ncbi:DUF4105 domain-containing protein [Aquimarina brevivitae]|uniref:lipoprotein N-acyltransferase Lnb domain-containing protein n=1 Tax=Aquimarina brevivitae TaxID=323412 RepID=UPI001029C57C|nr:DUF4105 domain-containing protein [Aquimarina brevivitae]
MKRFLAVITFSLLSLSLSATELKMDLLVNDPSDNLFSVFGHAALRIYKEKSSYDYVYSFGYIPLNFEGYKKFVLKGDVESFLKLIPYRQYITGRAKKKQNVYHYTLRVGDETIEKIEKDLRVILNHDNGRMTQDFLKSNCVLILQEIFEAHNLGSSSGILEKKTGTTYRQIINSYTHPYPWLNFFIDLLCGPNADKELTVQESFFIPKNYANYLVNSTEMVSDIEVTEFEPLAKSKSSVSPLVAFCIILLSYLLIKAYVYKNSIEIGKIDKVILMGASILSIYLLLWLWVDQLGSQNNLNILWANPIVFIPLLYKKFFKPVQWTYAICVLIWCGSWLVGYQNYPIAVIPLILLISIALFTQKEQLSN